MYTPLSPFPPLLTGVPLSPNPMVDSITSRAAMVSWLPPFSIFPLIQYNITWVQVDTGEDNLTTIGAGTTQLLLTNLRPNRMYHVTVVAVNRLGASLPSDPVVFITAEDGRLEFSKLCHCKCCTSTSLSFYSLCSTRGTSDQCHILLDPT